MKRIFILCLMVCLLLCSCSYYEPDLVFYDEDTSSDVGYYEPDY